MVILTRRSRHVAAVIALAALLLNCGVARPEGGEQAGAEISVTGVVPTSRQWTGSQFREAFSSSAKSIEYTSHGQKHTAHCIPLLAVLNACGVQTQLKMDPKADPKIKNRSLRLAVFVQSRDGYCAAFTLGELLPEIGRVDVWLALDRDDKPNEGDGVNLIVPSDALPGRWVRDIAIVSVIDCQAVAATQPAATQP